MLFHAIPKSERPTFLMKHYQDPLFDQRVFKVAAEVMKDYGGGYWEYMLTDDGVPFVMLRDLDSAWITDPVTKKERRVNNILSGMLITLYTLQSLMGDYVESLSGTFEALSQHHENLIVAIEDYCVYLDRRSVIDQKVA